MRLEVLEYFHDHPHSGHMGYRKTLKRLCSRVYWFQIQSDIFSYVKTCATCQACKNPTTKSQGELKSISTNRPWDNLAVDLMIPLPTTRNSNAHLLVVVDHFSKWVELFAIKNAQASTVCAVLQNEIFCRWGTPRSLLSDNATYFRSKTFQNMCNVWGVKHKFTTPYHPQVNIVERVNRNIRAILSSYVATKHNKWDSNLPAVALALRTAVSDSTGLSPAFLNFGREISLPFDRAISEQADGVHSRSQYKADIIEKLASMYTKARSNIERSQVVQKRNYDKRHKKVRLEIGDLVLLRTHYLSDKVKKFTKKLAYRWSGPYLISKVPSNLTYELSSLDKSRIIGVYNVQHIKRYFDRPSYFDSFSQN